MMSHTSRTRLVRRWLTGAAAMLTVVAMPWAVRGAQPPPLEVALRFQAPPPNAIFALGAAIPMRLQVRNTSGAPLYTAEGFSRTEYPRFLIFIEPTGALLGTAAPQAEDVQPGYCFSRKGVLQRPTAIPVVPIEVLPTTFGQEYVFDARQLYDLTRPGRYSVEAQIPLLTVNVADPNSVINDCDQHQGTVLNVGDDPTGGTIGRQAYTIHSNSLEFSIAGSTFGGFEWPLTDDAKCSVVPCETFRLGVRLPVRFKLLDANGQVVKDATPQIAVTQIQGAPPKSPPTNLGAGPSRGKDEFIFIRFLQEYLYFLNTDVLSVGTWRVDVLLDDGTVRSVHIGLRKWTSGRHSWEKEEERYEKDVDDDLHGRNAGRDARGNTGDGFGRSGSTDSR
jgi:hypothetical protein